MKIALCFSGQPRFVNECANSIITNLIHGYDVDVFAHLWFDLKLQNEPYKYGGDGNWQFQRISANAVQDFQKLYNPKDMLIEESRLFCDKNISMHPTRSRYFAGSFDEKKEPNYEFRVINNNISYFYSLSEANRIKKAFEYKNNFKYDVVVRCRTDTICKQKIYYENYDMSFLHFTNINNQPDGMVCDWFNFSSSENMDIFMNIFPVFTKIYKKCMHENNNAWCNEMLHRKMLDLFDISIQGHPISIELPRF